MCGDIEYYLNQQAQGKYTASKTLKTYNMEKSIKYDTIMMTVKYYTLIIETVKPVKVLGVQKISLTKNSPDEKLSDYIRRFIQIGYKHGDSESKNKITKLTQTYDKIMRVVTPNPKDYIDEFVKQMCFELQMMAFDPEIHCLLKVFSSQI